MKPASSTRRLLFMTDEVAHKADILSAWRDPHEKKNSRTSATAKTCTKSSLPSLTLLTFLSYLIMLLPVSLQRFSFCLLPRPGPGHATSWWQNGDLFVHDSTRFAVQAWTLTSWLWSKRPTEIWELTSWVAEESLCCTSAVVTVFLIFPEDEGETGPQALRVFGSCEIPGGWEDYVKLGEERHSCAVSPQTTVDVHLVRCLFLRSSLTVSIHPGCLILFPKRKRVVVHRSAATQMWLLYPSSTDDRTRPGQ